MSAARKPDPRIVHVECPTPHLYRWFLGQLPGVAVRTCDGLLVLDEGRWGALLAAAEGREVRSIVTVPDKGRGKISLTLRDGVVVGARKLAAGRKR